MHTYLHSAFFSPANLKSEVEHLKKKIQNMQENQDEIIRSIKSLERSLPRLVPTMTVVTPPVEMNNPLIATNPQETAAHPHSSPSPSATPQPASPTPSSTLLPITIACRSNSLPSSAIDRSGLCTVEEVLLKYPKLKVEGKMGKLACRLAQEAVFGTEIMKRCTPYGTKLLTGLPSLELFEIKKEIFNLLPQYWGNPAEFESTWKTCVDAIQQCCKRLRHNVSYSNLYF